MHEYARCSAHLYYFNFRRSSCCGGINIVNIVNIAIAQLNFLVGDIEGNAEKIIVETKNISKQASIDLIIFPELAITGYPPEDLLFRPALYERIHVVLQKIQSEIKNTTVIVGYPEKINDIIYNKAVVIQHGKIIANYDKQKLPNYTVFDEKRYFTAGNQPCVFELNGLKIALIICEDTWLAEPISQAKNAGATLIVSINASPFDTRQEKEREVMLKQRVTESHLPIV